MTGMKIGNQTSDNSGHAYRLETGMKTFNFRSSPPAVVCFSDLLLRLLCLAGMKTRSFPGDVFFSFLPLLHSRRPDAPFLLHLRFISLSSKLRDLLLLWFKWRAPSPSKFKSTAPPSTRSRTRSFVKLQPSSPSRPPSSLLNPANLCRRRSASSSPFRDHDRRSSSHLRLLRLQPGASPRRESQRRPSPVHRNRISEREKLGFRPDWKTRPGTRPAPRPADPRLLPPPTVCCHVCKLNQTGLA